MARFRKGNRGPGASLLQARACEPGEWARGESPPCPPKVTPWLLIQIRCGWRNVESVEFENRLFPLGVVGVVRSGDGFFFAWQQ